MGRSACDAYTTPKLAADQLEHSKHKSAVREISTLSMDSNGRRKHNQCRGLQHSRVQRQQKHTCKRHLEVTARATWPGKTFWWNEFVVLRGLVAAPACKKYRLKIQPFCEGFAHGAEGISLLLEQKLQCHDWHDGAHLQLPATFRPMVCRVLAPMSSRRAVLDHVLLFPWAADKSAWLLDEAHRWQRNALMWKPEVQ